MIFLWTLQSTDDDRERVKDDLVARLDGQVRSVEQQGFDDAITDADLEEPARADAFYDLNALDRV